MICIHVEVCTFRHTEIHIICNRQRERDREKERETEKERERESERERSGERDRGT